MSRAMGRVLRLQRIEELLLISTDGLTIQEIANRLNVHRSTAWRDIQTLSQELPIYQEGSRYAIDRGHYLINVRLNRGESLMLYLAMRGVIRQMTHIPPSMLSASEKLTFALQHPSADQLAECLQQYQSERLPDPDRAEVWEVLIEGWLEQIAVRFTYRKFHAEHPTEYEIHPLLFEPAVLSEGVYVIGYSVTHGELRTFKVERMLSARLTSQYFERQDSLNIDDLLRHAWGIWYGEELTTVRLRFTDPRVARRVKETLWHPSQRIYDLPGGGVEWVVEVAGTLELVPWIRGWGSACEVLEPGKLRRFISDDMRRAASLYRE